MAAKKLTGAALDAERKLQEAEIDVRAQMILSPDEEENSEVIHLRAAERMKPISSVPPSKRGIVGAIGHALVAVLNTLPPWSRPVVLIVLLVLAAGGGLSLANVAGWVK